MLFVYLLILMLLLLKVAFISTIIQLMGSGDSLDWRSRQQLPSILAASLCLVVVLCVLLSICIRHLTS